MSSILAFMSWKSTLNREYKLSKLRTEDLPLMRVISWQTIVTHLGKRKIWLLKIAPREKCLCRSFIKSHNIGSIGRLRKNKGSSKRFNMILRAVLLFTKTWKTISGPIWYFSAFTCLKWVAVLAVKRIMAWLTFVVWFQRQDRNSLIKLCRESRRFIMASGKI